jgi:hypothetical protein
MSITHQMAAVILSAIIAAPALAQREHSWANLETLKFGDRIGIIQSDLKRLEGRFAGFSDSGISIRTDQTTTVEKENVVSVYRRPRTRRTLRAVVGAAIGAGVGVLLSRTVGDRFRNEGQEVPSGAWIGGSSAIGAGVGALSGGGYRTVYLRSK